MKKRFLYTDAQVRKNFYGTAQKAVKKKFAGAFDDEFYALIAKSNSHFAEFLEKESTMGKCYVFALLLSQFIPDCTLVHGVLRNLNKSVNDAYYESFEHAWVESNGLIFDTTSKCWFDKNKYYDLYDVEVSQNFTQEDLKNEETLVKLAKNSVRIYKEMQEPLCRFSPFKELQDKIICESASILSQKSKQLA